MSALPGVESVKVLISDEIAILLPLMSGGRVMIAKEIFIVPRELCVLSAGQKRQPSLVVSTVL